MVEVTYYAWYFFAGKLADLVYYDNRQRLIWTTPQRPAARGAMRLLMVFKQWEVCVQPCK